MVEPLKNDSSNICIQYGIGPEDLDLLKKPATELGTKELSL